MWQPEALTNGAGYKAESYNHSLTSVYDKDEMIQLFLDWLH
ncbi:hypothetical protein [Lysinibacillus sphaericus]|nr:hypothetical protein [Lysinibacillus sphaericus]